MRAISIRQPWVHAILHFGKRVENREWDPNGGNVAHARRLVGETVALHVGLGCTRDEYIGAGEFMRDIFEAHPWEGSHILPGLKDPALTRGAIVGTARLVDIMRTDENGHRVPVRGVGVPNCRLCGLGCPPDTCTARDPWAIPGCLGLILADVVALPVPVPWSGALGFFEVPDSVVSVEGVRA